MLGSLERTVIATLRDVRSGTTRDVLDELRRRKVEVAYTTVATILARLHRKGLVGRRSERYRGVDRYVYAYKDIEGAYIDNLLQGVLAAFGEKGVVHLAERIEGISPADVRRLRERLKV